MSDSEQGESAHYIINNLILHMYTRTVSPINLTVTHACALTCVFIPFAVNIDFSLLFVRCYFHVHGCQHIFIPLYVT